MNKDSLHGRKIITNISAGLIAGLMFVVLSISLSTLIFSGALEPYLSRGIGLFLFSAVALAVVVALLGKFRGFTVTPQDGPAALLAVAAGGITSVLIAKGNPEAVFPTVAAGIIVCSLVTGLAFFLIGRFNLGNLVRFIPYPVVGGFLAGTGWLLTRGSLEVMIGRSLSADIIPSLLSPDMMIRWLPGTIFASIVFFVIRRVSHYLVWPGIIFGGLLVFYITLFASGSSLEQARSAGLLLGTFPSGGLWAPFTPSAFTKVDWGVLAGQLDKLIPIPLVSLISFLLNATGLELIAKRDIDLNHELRVTGMANMLAGLGGGPAGYLALGPTSLAQQMGAKTPIVTLTAASVCGTVLLFGGGFISYLPVALLSSLLLVLGLSFLVDWVYVAWFKLPKPEYLIVLISLVMIASIGFLEGILIGIFAATILFVYNYSRVETISDTLNGQIYRSNVDRPPQQRETLKQHGESIHIYRLQGYIFFGTADNL
ncbi:MAG TPA: SulP family inorganic anion transporter, partial [Anaerolineales bacterium]